MPHTKAFMTKFLAALSTTKLFSVGSLRCVSRSVGRLGVRAAQVIAITTASVMAAHASMVDVSMEAVGAPSYGSFGSTSPFLGLTGPFSVVARFSVDDSSGVLFGDPNCGFYGPGASPCVGYGYEVKSLSVSVNGVVDEAWVTGINSKSFSFGGGAFDVRGKGFFTPGAISNGAVGGVAWLPIINAQSQGVAMNLGGMYQSVGGVAFLPYQFGAQDSQGSLASGSYSVTSSAVAPVPLPSGLWLLIAGLASLITTNVWLSSTTNRGRAHHVTSAA